MVFINDCKVYATIWKVEDKQKFADVRMSTSEKSKEGTYINSNWSFVKFVGKAYDKVKNLSERDRIIITKFKISNVTKDKKTYFNFTVLDCETESGYNKTEGDLPY